MTTKIITIANNKGGVAKTTTAYNMAKCLSTKQKKVLLIDLDPQANTTSLAGIDKEQYKNQSITEIFLHKETDIKNLILELQDIDIITSHNDLQKASDTILTESNNDHRLEIKIKSIINLYDFIIIDTPPAFNILTKNGIIASTDIIIPIQAQYIALQGTADFIQYIYKINEDLTELDRPTKSILGALITYYDSNTALSKQIEKATRHQLSEIGIKTFDTIIHKNTTIAEAPAENKSIFEYNKNSQGAKDYEAFTDELLQLLERKQTL